MKKLKFMALFMSMTIDFGSCGSMSSTANAGVRGVCSGAAWGA